MMPSFSLKIPEFLNKVKSVIKISKGTLTSDSSGIFEGTTAEKVFEELETQLLLADVGVETTMWLLNEVRQEALTSREEGLDIAKIHLFDQRLIVSVRLYLTGYQT